MPKYKLKKGQKIGSLSAEADVMLSQAFVDTGYLDGLLNIDDPRFLILGRTGSGKTALLQILKSKAEHVTALDPDDLSMQYLHSNTILSFISDLGIHLDIFFKYLWKHICILELIKIRYKNSKESKHNLLQILYSDEKKAEQKALRYLSEHGDQYWITADTHIKNFTSELETKVKEDNLVGSKLKGYMSEIKASTKSTNEKKFKEEVDGEILSRTQAIVNDYQIAALNEVFKRLSEKSFYDNKKQYYIIIDDLDKNWMPHDKFYTELIKSLLYTVKEINQKLNSVKIHIALRTNIYYRIFKKSNISEPQREKWADVIFDIEWRKNELAELLNRRLNVLLREQYTNNSPTIEDILPAAKKKINESAFNYIIDRTFFRPRDIIEFINLSIEENGNNLNLSWSSIQRAEILYSKNRLNSIIDEWKDSFFGLPALFSLLEKYPARFTWIEFTEDDLIKFFEYKNLDKCSWLSNLYQSYCNNIREFDSLKAEVLNVLFLTGLIGYKDPNSKRISYSYQKSFSLADITLDELTNLNFVVHKSFWKAFGISKE